MKTILVLLHDDPGQEARLQAALDLARAVGGHLECLNICQPPPPGPDSSYGMPDVAAALFEDARTEADLNYIEIERRLSGEDVSWSMSSGDGDIALQLAEHMGLADVLVLNRELDGAPGPDMVAIGSRLVLKARRPILAVPRSARGFDPFGTVVVAWDGSEPAGNALALAVPLLALARAVVLFECPEEPGNSIREAAAYLSRHGIHADVKSMPPAERSRAQISRLIKSTCAKRNASYCVMGAYGHSRLREALLGGVTRAMLRTSPIPLFIAH